MKCPKCQSDNAENAKFCNECGSRLELRCPKCGRTNRPGSKFCNQCGHNLFKRSSPSESPEIVQQPDTLSRTPEAAPLPEGERRQATIVFSDLSGYTSMNERLDPEEVEAFMRRIKKEAIRIVESHDGIVNQFVGDEVLALFGIPTAHEDDPIRAIKAALKLHKIVRKASPEVENRVGEPVRMHTGVHTGLIVTNLRDDRDGIFGITGDTVNMGARLKSHAKTDEILISQKTQQLIGPYFETEVFGEIKLKGISEPIISYRVIGESKIHSRFEASEKKGFTPYAGRIQELSTLRSCLEKAVDGNGQFVTVAGEAGVGKSRLHYEFRHSLDREKLTILQGRCQSYGSDTPYLPFLDALRRGLQLKDEDSPAELLKKVVANSKAIDPALEQYVPLYLHLLSIRSNYALPEHLQGRELRKAVEEAFATVITLNTQHQPMVLILEDWHWSDEASQAVLKHLIGMINSYPLMVVLTYRPYHSESWGYLSYHTSVVLKPLDSPHTEQIIKSVTGANSLPAGLAQLIHDRTGGNPLFVEEVCYSLIEEGVVVVKNERAVLTKSLENLVLPETVQAIIRTRLDRLDGNTKEALRLASVIGRVFSQRILERIYSARAALSDSLEALKAIEVIQQIRVLPEAEYTFRHVLAQTVAYETLLLKRRKELHGAIGEAIEELYCERLEEQASILAYHYARSDKPEKAVAFAFLAGDQAAHLCANTDATTYYEQALETARGLPSSPKMQQWQIDATLKLAAVGITRQDIERDRLNLERARELAEGLHDESRLSKVLYWLGRIHYVLWDPKIAMDFARQSLEIADRLRDDALAAPPVNLMGRVHYQLSDFPAAVQFLERSVQQMRRIGDKVEEATASAVAGYVLGIMGEFDRAFSHADHSIQLAQKIQNSFAEANAYHLRGTIHDQRGEWTQAITDYEKAVRVAENAEDFFRLYLVKSWKGRAHSVSGNPHQGKELLEESLALAERIGTKFWLPWQKTALSACLFMLGEVDSASPLCQEAIDLSEETRDKYVMAFAHRTFGEILSHIDSADPREAESSILEAIKIQHEIDAKPELARSYVSYARLMGKKEKEKARLFLAKALDMFQHMGMDWDLAQIEEIANNPQD